MQMSLGAVSLVLTAFLLAVVVIYGACVVSLTQSTKYRRG
jgi:hypothetical protein